MEEKDTDQPAGIPNQSHYLVLPEYNLRTIDTNPNTMTHVYNDGSALNAVELLGYDLYHPIPRYNAQRHISEACGQHCNNYYDA